MPQPSGPTGPGPTVEAMKGRLRAYELPVSGRAEDLRERLERLDQLRARWANDPDGFSKLTAPQVKAALDSLRVKAWKMRTKARMSAVLWRMLTRDEPATASPVRMQASAWAVTWVSPATLQRELYRGGLSRAAAERAAAAARSRVGEHLSGARFLPEFSSGGPLAEIDEMVRSEREPTRAFEPSDSAAEQDAGQALADIIRLDRSAMGPALSGDGVACRAISRRIELARDRLESARQRVWEERGVSDPRRRENPVPRIFYVYREVSRDGSFTLGLSDVSPATDSNLVGNVSAGPADCDRCAGVVRSLLRGASAPAARPFELNHASLRDDLHGLGLGSWMYAEAARMAWAIGRAALAMSSCCGGHDSPMSQRVWRSASLAQRAEVLGEPPSAACLWRARDADGSKAPPAPLGVTLVEPAAAAPRRVRRGR